MAAQNEFERLGPTDCTLQYECVGEATVTVRAGDLVSATGPGAASARTVDDLFETALLVFEDGRTGSVCLSGSERRIPVLVRIGRTEPEVFPTPYSGLLVTVTGFETLRCAGPHKRRAPATSKGSRRVRQAGAFTAPRPSSSP